MLFISFLIMISLVYTLQNWDATNVEPIGMFEMLKLTHKVLLGDYMQFDEVMTMENTGLDLFIWILFFLCTLILVIIMLNLLIAFINDAYEHLFTIK